MLRLFVVLGCVALAGPAAVATTVVGATTIRITNVLNTYLQVAEVQAFDFGSTNIALAGTASASSVWSAGWSFPARAIDGVTGGDYSSDGIFHSNSGPGEYFEVAIAPTTLASLTVWGRTDCCRDRDWFAVSILNAAGATLWSGEMDVRSGDPFRTVVFSAPPPPPGGVIPEPATWAMLVTGFGLLGRTLRRRREATA